MAFFQMNILFLFLCNLLIYKKVVYVLRFNSVFYGQNEKGEEKKKSGKKFDPPPLGFEPQIFEQNFPVQDLNFEGD